MTDLDHLNPTPDERVMAALSHISALLPLIGVIAPIVIWITQKEKSQYVAFQSLQAVAYQLTMIIAWFLGMGCYMCSFFGTFLSLFVTEAAPISQSSDFLAILISVLPFLMFGVIFVFGIAFIIYGVIAAILAFQGKPFRYAIIGKRVERFMLAGQPAAGGVS